MAACAGSCQSSPFTEHDFRQLIVAIEAAAGFLRSIDGLEHHGQSRRFGQASLRQDCAVAHSDDGALYQDRGALVLSSARQGNRRRRAACHGPCRGKRRLSLISGDNFQCRRRVWRHAPSPTIQISWRAFLAFGCWLFRSVLRTFAVLSIKPRRSGQVGPISPSTYKKPIAPSVTTGFGGTEKPRR